jgi:hypothetical protein
VESDLTMIERWFEHRGLPHFIEGRRAATQIWTRATPLLVVFFLLGSLNALDLKRWSAARNISVSVAALGIVLAAWMLSNRLRGQRMFAMPDRVGKPELALFVLGPAIPALVFGPQWGSFIAAIVEGVALLGIIYLAASYGLPSMLRWGFSRLRSLAPTFGNLIVRALPLLLLFVAILFLTAEVWQFAGTLTGAPYWLVLLSFMLLGGLFLATRLPGDVESIGRFDSWEEVRQEITDTPARNLDLPVDGDPEEPPLRRRHWLNVGLVMLFSQAIQITLVALAMFGFLMGFGFLAMHLDVQQAWIGDIAQIREFGHVYMGAERLSITEPLLRVCGFLASFSGFYFTIYLVTDSTYRDEFRVDVVGEVRDAFAVRLAYLFVRRFSA